ncbi:MAG: hypothetical protein IT276_17220 [Ignavibacteriaceae bacterium]|nr:hypothetical protein [Ignavibacterium sp.]MCC6256657.1 hypothetical protein [Ignavibacteriaceae bacterium]HMN23589.1 hypothetical protein [Ignavibacteriaceae bacterium]HRN25302.1 hypothetical protein [Ignavibacteriaceae bacterium]HRP91611.1 hypothetical protein [Ignavibacteriaceae bacterium]
MVKRFFFILFFTFGFNLFAQQITATAFTDTTDYMIGDQIKYSLSLEMDKNVYIINPFFKDSLKNIDVLAYSDPIAQESENGKTVKYICVLSRFDSAEVTIPPIKIEYRTKGDSTLKYVLSNSVSFNVHRVNVDVKEEIKDIKPPIRPFDFTFLIYILIAFTIISVLVYYFIYRKYLKRKQELVIKKKEEKLLSHQIALRKLAQLEKEELWQKGFVKDYHSKITEIIREYFEKQFGLPALERTTTESLKLLSKHPQGIKVIDITSQFFSNADLVKFAKFTPIESVNFEMMNQAKEIVKKTMTIQKESEVDEQLKEAANV